MSGCYGLMDLNVMVIACTADSRKHISRNMKAYLTIHNAVQCVWLSRKESYPFNGRIKTAEQDHYTVIGTLAVDGWAVTISTARRGLDGLRPRPVHSSLYQM